MSLSKPQHPLGGRLRHFKSFWQSICKDRRILKLIDGVEFDFIKTPYQSKLPRQIKMSQEEHKFMEAKLQELLDNKSIVELKEIPPGAFVSNVFLVKKKSGQNQFRLIVNLSDMNRFLRKVKFKQSGITSALSLIKKDSFLVSLDIESSFSHLAVRPGSQKYIIFLYRDRILKYVCLPQGSSISPVSFVSVTKYLVKCLRKQLVHIFIYVDDTLIVGSSVSGLLEDLKITIDLFERAGFLLNYSKSQLQPTQQIEFLGFDIDTVAYTISLTKEKRDSICNLVSRILACPTKKITIKLLASIIGKIVATFPCSEEAPLHYRVLDRFKVKSLALNSKKWTARVILTSACLQELRWWQKNVHTEAMKKSLHGLKVTAKTFSDSSQHSFGGCYLSNSISSKFTVKQQLLSINTKELLAVYYTLSAFAPLLAKHTVLHHCDNQVSCHYLESRGGRCPLKDKITRKIFALAKLYDFKILVTWIASKSNSVADELSRRTVKRPQLEFTIPKDILYPAVAHLVSWVPNLDAFATLLNHRYPTYCSWHSDPFALMVNSFNLNWQNYRPYIFCPFSIIDRVLKKIEDDQVEHCIMLAPLFPTGHWFPKLISMARQPPLLLPNSAAKKLFLPWDYTVSHPLARHMRLILVDLCSDCFRPTTYLNHQRATLQTMAGDLVHLEHTPLAHGVGSTSVKKRKFVNTK